MGSSTNKVQERLLRKGRPVEPNFIGTEKLYRRVSMKDVDLDEHAPQAVLSSAFSEGWPQLSFNRSKFSEAGDVKYPTQQYWYCGAASIQVRHVPPGLRIEEGYVHIFLEILHQPLDENYSHSVVRSFAGPDHKDKEPQKVVYTKLRDLLASASLVEVPPKDFGDVYKDWAPPTWSTG